MSAWHLREKYWNKDLFIGDPSGVVVNVLDWDIIVSEFELLSRYCVHF